MTNRIYSAQVDQFNSTTANRDETFIEISIPAGTTIKIRRIYTTGSRGDDTGSNGHYWPMKYMITSATVSDGMAAYTPIPRDPGIAASLCTVKRRNNASLPNAPGTLVTLLDIVVMWTNNDYEFFAQDEDDSYTITGAKFFVISRADSTTVGTGFNVVVQWEEI